MNKNINNSPVAGFVEQSSDYYVRAFDRLADVGMLRSGLNVSAFLLGPLWAAARGLWWLFWCSAVFDVTALAMIGRALWNSDETAGSIAGGLALLVLARLLLGLIANWAYQQHYTKWRTNPHLSSGMSRSRAAVGALLLAATCPLIIYRASCTEVVAWIETFPTNRVIARNTAIAIDELVDWMTVNFEWIFDIITHGIRAVLDALELLFIGTPWPVMAFLLLLISWRVAGFRVVLFTAGALLYLGLFGFWDKAMSTIALVGASVFICLVVGTPIGIWCAKNKRANAVINPILDLMQTMPSFVYLIPAIAFFSIGKPPAVLATVVFAMPPMIRLTTLGILQVPHSVIEAMQSFGASPRQILFKAEIPLAVPSILTGINQSIMMSLSMVVIAALIGAGGLGYDVLQSLQQLETGKGLLAGLAIVVSAMILDRIVKGKAKT